MKKIGSLILAIVCFIIAIALFVYGVNAQPPTPIAVDIQIVESNPKSECDIYNNVKVGQILPHTFAALGKKLTLSKKELDRRHNYFVVDKWITIYSYKEIVWRIEYKGLRLPCHYQYDSNSNTQRYLTPDGTIVVIYDPSDGTTYVTNLPIWYRVIMEN